MWEGSRVVVMGGKWSGRTGDVARASRKTCVLILSDGARTGGIRREVLKDVPPAASLCGLVFTAGRRPCPPPAVKCVHLGMAPVKSILTKSVVGGCPLDPPPPAPGLSGSPHLAHTRRPAQTHDEPIAAGSFLSGNPPRRRRPPSSWAASRASAAVRPDGGRASYQPLQVVGQRIASAALKFTPECPVYRAGARS